MVVDSFFILYAKSPHLVFVFRSGAVEVGGGHDPDALAQVDPPPSTAAAAATTTIWTVILLLLLLFIVVCCGRQRPCPSNVLVMSPTGKTKLVNSSQCQSEIYPFKKTQTFILFLFYTCCRSVRKTLERRLRRRPLHLLFPPMLSTMRGETAAMEACPTS